MALAGAARRIPLLDNLTLAPYNGFLAVSLSKRARKMRTFEVKILGQRYKMRSDEGEEYLNSLADFVNEKISEVQKSTKTVATHNLAILAALNIADTLFKLREQEAQAKKEVRDRVKRILKLIRVGQQEGA